ncbi:TonB-dependent receptor plug domain-containing protein [Parabacteroides pacaensis]|uniref:TonB-dependent receptor plug domain-containing protein n=1 Tax=Parabacteroides pacaensis TaxID=2086575 RepID=UPI000D0F0AC1|nr:TonB-dependent receptor [Parabacteroides pacaensis]
MKNRLLIFIALLAGTTRMSIKAESLDSIIPLKTVVVSANKIQVNRNSVPLSISVINRDQIEASSESALLPVLSQRVPGLFVTQKGITGFGVSEGAAGTVNIRGVGQGNKVLMLFDGQPQWAGIFGHALPDTYVASDVEKVEVIRGPGSLLYGSNAMGGVVNIITRRHDQPGRRTQARIMYGSYNTQKYMINNGYNIGNFTSFISVNHDRTDGHRPDSKFHITNGFANLGYKFNDHYKINGNLSLAKFKNQNPGKTNDPIFDNIMNVTRGTTSLGVENNYQKTSGALRLFYNWGDHKINDGYHTGKQPKTTLFRSDDHNYGLLLYQSFRLIQGNSFTVGLDYKNWGGHAWNDNIQSGDKANDIIDKKIDETAGYAIMQQDLFNMLSLNAGVRYEHNSSFGGEWIPQAGIAFRPFTGNAIKASLSKGFRSPNLRELYMYGSKNPDLKPENMMNYELSIGQYWLDGKLFTELTAFYIDGKDMIQAIPVDGKDKNMNTGSFTNKGIEFELTYQPLNQLSFDANYSYLHTSKPLIAAPEHKAYFDITYSPGRFVFNVNVQSIFDLYINTNTKKKEDYTLLNAKAMYRFGTRDRGFNLFVKGENLTATRYSINEGFPMPKAIVMGGIDITF